MAGNRKAAESPPESNDSGVYLFEDLTVDKGYIGSSVRLKARIGQHDRDLRRGDHSNWRLQKAFDNDHQLRVLVVPIPGMDEPQLRQHEEKLIKGLMPSGRLYNLTTDTMAPGAGREVSDETRKKMSEAHTGKKRSETARQNISNGLKGYKHTDEFREKCRNRMLGHSPTTETREKLRVASTGRQKTETELQKLHDAHIGRPKTPEHAAKSRAMCLAFNDSRRIPITVDGILYESVLEASRQTGIPKSTLQNRQKKGVYG